MSQEMQKESTPIMSDHEYKIHLSETHQYDDIIHQPHHTSTVHARMSVLDRAAQFSPFAALTGYEAAIEETGRLTDAWVELDENMTAEINENLQIIMAQLANQSHPEVTITYFVPDANKEKIGGAYRNITGAVKKVDEAARVIIFKSGVRIDIDRIMQISPAAMQAEHQTEES